MKFSFSALIGAALVAFSLSSHATIIHDNGASDPTNRGAFFSRGSQFLADDFSTGAATTIRSAQFWGGYWSSGAVPAAESFTVRVYGDNGGLPNGGNLIGTSGVNIFSRIDTGFNHNSPSSADIWEWTVDLLSPISIAGPGNYWFSVVSATHPGVNFFWQESGVDGAGSNALSQNSGTTWSAQRTELAWNISDSIVGVPAPATLALFGLGLAALGFAGRKKA